MEGFGSVQYVVIAMTDSFCLFKLLDVKDIGVVVNFDFPGTIEDYVHRIGRTGRAGAKGTAYSFMTSDKGKLARQLVQVMREAKQTIPPEIQALAHSSRGGE